MTAVLLRNARLIDPEAGNETDGSLLIENGVIQAVGAAVDTSANDIKSIDCGGKMLAPGIIDIGVKVCEPGERHKESFKSAGQAAAAGGVTTIVTRPDTLPAIDTPETLEFTRRRANEAAPVNVLTMAALTKGREGREMTEIGFLLDAGAVGFTDCDRVITRSQSVKPTAPASSKKPISVISRPSRPLVSAAMVSTFTGAASLARLRVNSSVSGVSIAGSVSGRVTMVVTPPAAAA